MRIGLKALATATAIGLFVGAVAKEAGAQVPDADVALILAADVSGSMSPEENELQRNAYASALTHPDVWQAIKEGPHGRIYISYFEWSDCHFQRTIVPWTVVDDPGDLVRIAATITSAPEPPGLNTCLTGALKRSIAMFSILPSPAERYVLDISGDGEHNAGDPPWPARLQLLDMGVVINAIPISKDADRQNLFNWYSNYVIGGPGSFMEPVINIQDLEPALRRKLVLEIG